MEIVDFLNENYWKDSDYFLLAVLSVIVILLNKKGENRGKRMAVYSVLVFFVVICNPIVARMGLIFFGEDKYAYMRIFYLIPLMTLIAYAGTKFYISNVKQDDGGKKKLLFAAIICITIVASGKFYDSTMYREVTNIYKIDQNAFEICDMINEDCDNGPVNICAPGVEDIHYGIRQYAGNIAIVGDSNELNSVVALASILHEYEVEYLVMKQESSLMDNILQGGFEQLGESGNYIVFKRAES